jgi:hypothetical protein
MIGGADQVLALTYGHIFHVKMISLTCPLGVHKMCDLDKHRVEVRDRLVDPVSLITTKLD